MDNKFKKTTKFEKQVQPARKYSQAINLSIIYELEGDAIEDVVVSYDETFGKLADIELEIEKNTGLNKGKILGGRYGSVISINEQTAWTLDLVAKSSSISSNKKVSITNALDIFLDHAVRDNLSENDFAQKYESKRKNLEFINSNLQNLNRVFIVRAPSWTSSVNDIKYEESELEVFIPDVTYHPVPLFRFLLLGLIEPSLLSPWDLDVISYSFSELGLDTESFVYKDSDIKKRLQNTSLDFKKLYELSIETQEKIDSLIDMKTVFLSGGKKRKRYDKSRLTEHVKKMQPLEKDMWTNQSIIGSLSQESINLFEQQFKIWQYLSKKMGYFKREVL